MRRYLGDLFHGIVFYIYDMHLFAGNPVDVRAVAFYDVTLIDTFLHEICV